MNSTTNKSIYRLPGTDLKFDPLEIHRKLILATQGKLSELVSQYNEGESEFVRAGAEEALVQATRQAFGLKKITEGSGFGDVDVLAFLSHYLEWLSTPPAPTFSQMPISRPCTDCPPPSIT